MAALRDYIKIKHGFAFKGDHISTDDNGTVLVTPGNFSIGGGFKEEKCKFFDGEYPADYVLKPDDLIVTMTDLSKSIDTLGYSALVPDSERTYLHNQRIGLVQIIDSSSLDKHFLYWFMRTSHYQKTIAATSSGSTVHHTSPDRIMDVEIELPELEKQRSVAVFLDSIELKINTNKEINKNLEQQAQAIFKSWFVDFEPFNGEMPHDWIASRLGDIASIKTNNFSPVKNPDAQLEHYSIPAYDEQKYPVFESAAGVKSNKYILSKNSVMISKLNPDTKRVWRPMCLSELAVSSTEFIIFEAFNPAYRDFVFSIIDSAAFSDWMCAHTTGSTNSRQRTAPSATLEFQVALPDEKAITDFCAIVTPMYDTIASNICENQKLAQLRDSILPKLMSGELDVSDIDF